MPPSDASDEYGPDGPEDGEPIDLVASVGDLDPVVGLLRDFLHRSGAVRAVAVLDTEPAAIVDCGRLQPIEVSWADGRIAHLPHAIELDAEALPCPEVRQLPAFEVDAEAGTVASPMGGLQHYAEAVLALADVLGGRSVALATFTTTDPDVPLSLSARVGEPMIVALGEDEYELPAA